MKKLLLLFIISPILLFSQAQIGLDIDGEVAGDYSGHSVSLSSDGSVIAIGAIAEGSSGSNAGYVSIYRNQDGVWTQIGQDIEGETAGDRSGFSVSLSSDGSVVAIGAVGYSFSTGHVRIYSNPNLNGVWTQVGQDIIGEVLGESSGRSISLSSDGSVVAIGAPFNRNGPVNSPGNVRIYSNPNLNGIWTQIGSDIDGEATNDLSGWQVSLSSDGSVVAIGATQNNGNGSNSGHVRIFSNPNLNGEWTQVGQDIDGETTGDFSGSSLSLSSDGNVVAIGAHLNDGNGTESGHVRIYRNLNEVWTQIGLDIDGEAASDQSGFSVSLSSDGSVVAIGAPFTNGEFTIDFGHVRIYRNQSEVWTKIGSDIDGEASPDQSGYSVSLSSDGSVVAIGTPFNDGNGSNSGHVRVYDLSSEILGVSDDFVLSQVSIYPNPAKNSVIIELKEGLELQNINIYNNLGQFISTTKKVKVDTSNLTTGLYFLEIKTNIGNASKKLIIE
ncbi:MAG: T9SS type A sorting domain-containing protein [Algibacter sp.]